ncbi:MAG: hypothetical protein Q9185_004418 [Variospora sp. 1 TL-2023]
MGRNKIPRTESPSGLQTRHRVTKACQRCRLKKCKCDGRTPCSRCRSDDAICSYARHQHFDKILYRKGYVQMLERQQAQLTAGVQTLYALVQRGQPMPPAASEINSLGQPLVHKVLQRLGVLSGDDPWDEVEAEDVKSESPSDELNSAIATNFPPDLGFFCPGDAISGSPVENPQASSEIVSQTWPVPSAADTVLFPWATGACQFLDVEHLGSQPIDCSTGTDSRYGDMAQRSRFEQYALGQPAPGPCLWSQPLENNMAAYGSQFARDQSAYQDAKPAS